MDSLPKKATLQMSRRFLLPVLAAILLLSATAAPAHAQEVPESGGRVFGLVGAVVGDGDTTVLASGGAGLKQLMSSNLKVGRAWAIKDTFMGAFAIRQPRRAERALQEVLAWMSRSRLAPIVRAGRTVRRHFDGVMNAILSGITNATAEAINSRIQWLKKQAAGFRSRERFRQAIYFHLGGLDLYPDEAGAHAHPNS